MEKKDIRYLNSKKDLICPCCYKPIHHLHLEREATEQLIKILQNHPEDTEEIIVSIFEAMHFPERGLHLD